MTGTTTQAGSYRVENVPIPAGEAGILAPVTATITIKGVPYSGQNTADILRGAATTNNVQIVVSPTATQGAIAGTVRDANGVALSGASVYASFAFATPPTAGQATFSNFAAFLAITAADGSYRLPALPPGARYKVVAQYPGKTNSSVTGLTVNNSQTTSRSFNLATPATSPALSPPNTFTGFSLTLPATATRAALSSRTASGIEAVRQQVLKMNRLDNKRLAVAGKTFVKATRTRAAGDSLIENVLTWDYEDISNLYGYRILRSVNSENSFVTYATVQDPLAERFSDTDSNLAAGIRVYYNLVRLETVGFPASGIEGPVDAAVTIVTIPLSPIGTTTPAEGATTSATPTFTWLKGSRAALYNVLIYDAFPAYQSDSAANATPVLAKLNLNSSAATGSTLSLTYPTSAEGAAPALTAGHTYYYVIVASDLANAAFAFSPIGSFIVQ